MTSMDALLGEHRVMVILRGLPAAEAVAAARRAWDAGVRLVEVPLGPAGESDVLAAVVAAGAEQGHQVGAGTVITTGRVHAAAAAGAAYTVAPGLDPDVLAASLAAGLPHLPGAATATEVQRAWAAGCRWVKVFPASTLGPGWVRAMAGPFPDMGYVATGGVSWDGAPDYLAAAGAVVVAFGAAVAAPDQVGRLAELVKADTRSARRTPDGATRR